MLTEEYKILINNLIGYTNTNKIVWKKGDGYNSFYFNLPDNRKILMDKYFSIVNGQQMGCVNMTIFDLKDEIIDEVVLCPASDRPQDFELLNALYKHIELQFVQKSSEKIHPIINDITHSLQERLG